MISIVEMLTVNNIEITNKLIRYTHIIKEYELKYYQQFPTLKFISRLNDNINFFSSNIH